MLGYLRTFIGNLNHQDLHNFLRFVTGSSVDIDKKISVTLYSLSGLARRPISYTCSCTLELMSRNWHYERVIHILPYISIID